MNFLANVSRFQVLAEILGQQMPAVRRRVDEHVRRGDGDRAVEHHLERLVARLVGVERQVVTEDEESLATVCDQVDDVGQIDQVTLIHLDQAQTLVAVLGQHRFDQRRLAGAAGTREQHVVGGQAGEKLARVGIDHTLVLVDRNQIVEANDVRMHHRMQVATLAPLAPAKRARFPIRLRQGWRQQRFEACEHGLGARQERLQGIAVGHRRLQLQLR